MTSRISERLNVQMGFRLDLIIRFIFAQFLSLSSWAKFAMAPSAMSILHVANDHSETPCGRKAGAATVCVSAIFWPGETRRN
jgi:hypothetical protein